MLFFLCAGVKKHRKERQEIDEKTCKQTIRGEKSRRENGKTYMLHFSELIPPRAPVKMHKSANIGMRRKITGLTSFSSHSNNHVGARRGDDCRFVSTIFRSFPGHLRWSEIVTLGGFPISKASTIFEKKTSSSDRFSAKSISLRRKNLLFQDFLAQHHVVEMSHETGKSAIKFRMFSALGKG